MNRNEEIFIILKRIPDQAEYLREKLYDIFLAPIPLFIHSDYISRLVRERERYWLLVDSAEGVLFNLIERLNELINDDTGETKSTP